MRKFLLMLLLIISLSACQTFDISDNPDGFWGREWLDNNGDVCWHFSTGITCVPPKNAKCGFVEDGNYVCYKVDIEEEGEGNPKPSLT